MIEQVDITRLCLHPQNSNRMPPDRFRKLKRNIELSGRYPALVVRTLAQSAKYGPGSAYYDRSGGIDALQVIDGEHRLKALKDLGYTTVTVDNWGGLDDLDATRLLLTLNRLRGQEDTRKRADLLSLLRSEMQDTELAEFIPESAGEIAERVEIMVPSEEEVEQAAEEFEPLTLFVDGDLGRIIAAAIKLRRSKGNLPGNDLDKTAFQTIYSPYQKARALASICADYILANTKEE